MRFIGFDPDIWSHLAHADIILVPSVADEPFGNTAVEAMLAQRPLVVSSTTGLKEAAADYGSVRRIPPDDSAALAQAVLEIRDDWDATIAHCAADRDLALRRHAPTVYQQQIVAVIADLVAGRNSRGRGRRGD